MRASRLYTIIGTFDKCDITLDPKHPSKGKSITVVYVLKNCWQCTIEILKVWHRHWKERCLVQGEWERQRGITRAVKRKSYGSNFPRCEYRKSSQCLNVSVSFELFREASTKTIFYFFSKQNPGGAVWEER